MRGFRRFLLVVIFSSLLGAIFTCRASFNVMPSYNVVFESEESINGVVPRANDWVLYKCQLTVKDGGKTPVSLRMEFVPPHPFMVNMPLEHHLKAESISDAYGKVVRFLAKYGVEFRG